MYMTIEETVFYIHFGSFGISYETGCMGIISVNIGRNTYPFQVDSWVTACGANQSGIIITILHCAVYF